jgi:hypothetical protein
MITTTIGHPLAFVEARFLSRVTFISRAGENNDNIAEVSGG